MARVVNPFTVENWVMEPKPQNIWGIPHTSWFFAMGVGGALFINRVLFGIDLGLVFGMAVADLLSMILIGIGGLILIADLGQPWRVLRALLNPRTSWISVGAIADFVFLIFAGLWVIADLEWQGARPFAALPWAGNSPLGIAFQVIAGIAAFVVIVYPGLVLAASPSIPFWNTTLIPLQFLSFAFASALGLALIFALWLPVPPAVLASWAGAEVLLLAVTLLLFAAHLIHGTASHTAAKISVARLVKGELRVPFVWGTLVVGLLVPLFLGIAAVLGSSLAPGLLAVAALLTFPGNWLSKYAVIKAGYYAPFL
jgi:formate-dependent nitrite reductase membrane component NrfD